jgi:serine/threonine-protein kinase
MTTALGATHPRTLRCKLHRAWAQALVTRDPMVLQTMRAERDELARAINSQDKPVIWQTDLLIDSISRDLGVPGIESSRLARARAGLIALAGNDPPPAYAGLNSFS